MHRASNAYVQTQVTTTGQGEILVLLFDGAISFLNQAKEAIHEKLYEKKGNLISKALDIIDELESTLNLEKGGDLAKNLHTLYTTCSQKLIFANIRMNTQYIDEVIFVLSNLREGFAEIIDEPAAKMAAQQIAVKQQPTQAEQRKIPNFGQPNFTSNARASHLYAKKTAELSAMPVYPSSTPTEILGDKTSTISPVAGVSPLKVASPYIKPSSIDKGNITVPEKKEMKELEFEGEKVTETKQEPASFGGKATRNMDLYRKFSSLS